MDLDFSLSGPDPVRFQQWLSATFHGNNRTKTITIQKYDRICRYLRGDSSNTNAKFRYWVKSKGFYLMTSDNAIPFGHTFQGQQLLVKVGRHAKTEKHSVKSKKSDSRLKDFFCASKKLLDFTRVAVVENFYEIIKLVHVNKYGNHLGQKQTYKIISGIFSFLPREVVTHYLVNCAVCRPRMEKFGNGSETSKSRIFHDWQLKTESENCSTEDKKQAEFCPTSERTFVVPESQHENEECIKEADSTTMAVYTTGSSEATASVGETDSFTASCPNETADSEVILLDEGDVWEDEVSLLCMIF